jgi:hypothetical protein
LDGRKDSASEIIFCVRIEFLRQKSLSVSISAKHPFQGIGALMVARYSVEVKFVERQNVENTYC